MENKRTKRKADKMLSLLYTGERAFFFFYSGRQVYGKIEVLNVFEGRNIPQTFSAIVVKDFLCGNGAQRAGWCVLLW